MILITLLLTTNSGDPATGLTLSEIDIYLYRRTKAGGAVSTVWDGLHPTEEVGGGLYSRAYSDEDVDTYDYFAYAHYTGSETLDSDYALMGGVGGIDEGDVWEHSTRTLTQSGASVTAAVSGSTITITRGDTLSAALTDLGAVTGYVSIDFTVKESKADSDDDAVIRIRLNASGTDDGLLRLNGADASARAGNGSITIDDASDGDITITLAAAETDDLLVQDGLYYDVQLITATAVSTLAEGTCNVSGDVTRAIA